MLRCAKSYCIGCLWLFFSVIVASDINCAIKNKTAIARAYSAINANDAQGLEQVLSNALCVNECDNQGETPLIFAIKDNKSISRDVVASLLAHGADVAVTDKAGFSALDYAVLQGDKETTRLLLESTTVAAVPEKQFSSDISFGIVDLKFDGENVKICELGEGPRSMFKGFDSLYRRGELWRRLWHFLSCLQLTPWLVVYGFTNDMRLENALADYEALGGGYTQHLDSLAKNENFNTCLQHANTSGYFTNYKAVLIMRNNCYRDRSLFIFKKTYPSALPLCEALGPFANSKLLMNSLFEQDEPLYKYRPGCLVLDKKYTKRLSKRIVDTLQADCYVIKPVNSSKGNGVIVVKKRELFQLLRKVLKNPEKLPDHDDPTYGYWLRDRNKSFLVEEYAPSKLITVNGKKYDATMRVAFILFNDAGRIGITFLGSYWKLPAKSVSEGGSLTERHKSSIKPDHIGAAKVDLEDYEKVKMVLRKVLPSIYIKMLQVRENYTEKWKNS